MSLKIGSAEIINLCATVNKAGVGHVLKNEIYFFLTCAHETTGCILLRRLHDMAEKIQTLVLPAWFTVLEYLILLFH